MLSRIVLAFAGVYIIWGTTFLALAFAIRSIPPFISGGVRFVLAGTLMYAFVRSREARPFTGLHTGGTLLCGVLLSGIGNGFVVWSQQGLPSGIAALFVGAVPVTTAILDRLFFSRRTPSAQSIVGIVVGLAGIVVLSRDTLSLANGMRPIYLIAVLCAGVGWSIGTLLQRRYVPHHRVWSFTALQMLAGGVFQLLMSVIDREWGHFQISQVQAVSVFGITYLVVFGSLIAVNCYSFLVAHVNPTKVTTYALVNPVIALVLGAVVLNETITPAAIASTILVLVGVSLVLFQRRAAEPAAQ
ncbi:MAG TPA: EamA family transporter [Steroidobacteraceae bacterium]|jgi:drug/metabolite transporter (DMT)-like permease|nr:EamA family transporter [Steroidobacteraceae bacterium]